MWKTICNLLIFVGLLVFCIDMLYYQFKSSSAEFRKNDRIKQIIVACQVYINNDKIDDKSKVEISNEALRLIMEETNYDGSYKYKIGQSVIDLKK